MESVLRKAGVKLARGQATFHGPGEVNMEDKTIHADKTVLAMAQNEMKGGVKIISDARYGEVLGVHIVGARATELIGEAVLAMQLECTVNELAYTLRVHPTFSEGVVEAARGCAGWQ